MGLFSYLAIVAAQNDSFPEDHRYPQALQQEEPWCDQEESPVPVRVRTEPGL